MSITNYVVYLSRKFVIQLYVIAIWFYCPQKLLDYLAFEFECTWWRLLRTWRLFWVYLMKVILSVPDEGYSRNASCALDLISTVLIQHVDKRRILYWTFPDEYPSESVQGAFISPSIIWVGIQNLKKSLYTIVVLYLTCTK